MDRQSDPVDGIGSSVINNESSSDPKLPSMDSYTESYIYPRENATYDEDVPFDLHSGNLLVASHLDMEVAHENSTLPKSLSQSSSPMGEFESSTEVKLYLNKCNGAEACFAYESDIFNCYNGYYLSVDTPSHTNNISNCLSTCPGPSSPPSSSSSSPHSLKMTNASTTRETATSISGQCAHVQLPKDTIKNNPIANSSSNSSSLVFLSQSQSCLDSQIDTHQEEKLSHHPIQQQSAQKSSSDHTSEYKQVDKQVPSYSSPSTSLPLDNSSSCRSFADYISSDVNCNPYIINSNGNTFSQFTLDPHMNSLFLDFGSDVNSQSVESLSNLLHSTNSLSPSSCVLNASTVATQTASSSSPPSSSSSSSSPLSLHCNPSTHGIMVTNESYNESEFHFIQNDNNNNCFLVGESLNNHQNNTSTCTPPHWTNHSNHGENVSSIPSSLLIEQTKCFKCKLCHFLSLEASQIVHHIETVHKSIRSLNHHQLNETSTLSYSHLSSRAAVTASDTSYKSRVSHINSSSFSDENNLLSNSNALYSLCSPVSDGINRVTQVDEAVNSNNNHSNLVKSMMPHVIDSTPEQSDLHVDKIKCEDSSPLIETDPTNNHSNTSRISQQISQSNLLASSNSQSIESQFINKCTSSSPAAASSFSSPFSFSPTSNNRPKNRKDGATLSCTRKKCAIRFIRQENLKVHLECHVNRADYSTDSGPPVDCNSNSGNGFICYICSTFSSLDWASMAKHLWRIHQVDVELHKCNQCEYRHYSLSYLENNHAKIHSNEKNYSCDTCSKKFKNSKQLLNHERRHVNKPEMSLVLKASVAEITDANQLDKNGRSYPCDKCNKSFIDARALRVHRNVIHKITRAFICNACGRTSASRAALKTHMRSHTGEKPFKCQECDYSTSDHNSLRRHKMRHSGERPYKCPFCTYACIQSSTFKQHLRNKHPDESDGVVVFTCSICSLKTVSEELFKSHQKEHEIDLLGSSFSYDLMQTESRETNITNEGDFNPNFSNHRPMRTFKSDGESCSSSISSAVLSPSTPNSLNDSPSLFVSPSDNTHTSPSTGDDHIHS